MALKDPIHEGQLDVLRWIGDGCPDGRWDGHTYKTVANALASRRLVTVSRKGGNWRAELLPAGEYYLGHGDYPVGHWERKYRGSRGAVNSVSPIRPGPRSQSAPRPPKPAAKRSPPGLTPTRQLLADLASAGGVLERNSRDDKTKYSTLAAAINRHGMAPDGQHVVVYSGASYGEWIIRLVPVSEWQTEPPADVMSKDRIGRWHPVVAEIRSTGRLDGIGKEHRRRAAVLLHCLATEASARGIKVELVKQVEGRDYHSRRNQPPGLFVLSEQEFRCPVSVKQLQDQLQHEPTAQELARQKQWEWAHIPKYDHVPSERLAILTHDAASYPSEKPWADTKTRRLEDRLVDILAAFNTWVAADTDRRKRQRIEAEERAKRLEMENQQARAAYLEHTLGEMLQADAASWESAQRLRSYVEAMRRRTATIGSAQERAAADAWVDWCERYVEQVIDPLGRQIQQPQVPEPTDKDLGEFRRKLGFGGNGLW
ncbi:hypothetical protein QSJ18_19785 [Gordonia sp. ABSL1-1]|uniref:hypothetical protein n=1 Tax=Gordonia sp. ABSL1-1 TaxID=3053923 RepID=UPI002573D608|nr:hypothetical protein [Gordonia sp. ABSL1-1]MDL9938993.1 hypothetical protein [Gordonia sp. ABSL1-1]